MTKGIFPPVLVPVRTEKNKKIKNSLEIEPSNGLVIPNISHPKKASKSIEKIMPSLLEIRRSIQNAKNKGKHILVLPGSFDLVHKGHAFYVKKSVDCYCKAANCKRDDLFVVMLADDDDLISQVKSFKHKDNGGDEPQRRPVESFAERALSMASIPEVDIVGIIPAPNKDRSLLPRPPHFDIDDVIVDLNNNFEKYERERIALNSDNRSEEEISEKIKKDKKELEYGILAYGELEKNWTTDKSFDNVPVQAWQLYILSVVSGISSGNADHPERFKPQAITRLVNTEDTKYLGQVLFLMKYANIGVALLKYKIPGSSTTELIKWAIEEHEKRLASVPGPWDIIREFKKGAIGEHRLHHYNKAISEVESKFKQTI